MILLVLGVLLWSLAHLIPVGLPALRNRMAEKMGEMPYKGVFSLVILASVAMIVFGWRSIEVVTPLYDVPASLSVIALLLLILGFVLMAAARIKSNFKRAVRHPQLTGFTMWAVAHLMLNGDLRTTILFGGMAAWALVSMLLTNRRDGPFERPAPELPHKGVIVVCVGFVVFIAAALGHQYYTGVDIATKVAGS